MRVSKDCLLLTAIVLDSLRLGARLPASHSQCRCVRNVDAFCISQSMYAREERWDIHTEAQHEITQEKGTGVRGAGTGRGRFATLKTQRSLNALPTVALKYVTCYSNIFPRRKGSMLRPKPPGLTALYERDPLSARQDDPDEAAFGQPCGCGMEAEARLVERLPVVKILAEAGEQLQAEQDVFVSIQTDVDLTMSAMAATTSRCGAIDAVASPNGILPRR